MNTIPPLKVHLVDLKSYYRSPAYQLGLLVAYARTNPEVKASISFVFTEHQRKEKAMSIAQTIIDTDADLVAISNYAWNHKKIVGILETLEARGGPYPRIVLGGPNSAGQFGIDMFKQYPSIAAMVEGEGEPAFKDICTNLVANPKGDPFLNARNCLTRREDGEIQKTDMGHRVNCLDDVPSPYLEGIIPPGPSPLFYETNRGCPYRCTFCYWGNGNSRVYRMTMDRVKKEVEFFAENKVSGLWLADANFGIFPDDAKIARLICDANERHGNPIKFVGVNWAKNSSDRILEIASIFREGGIGVSTTLAIQSVTEQAEEISKRYAMPPSRFVNLVSNAEKLDIDTYTDLIWGLPGESLPEFMAGLEAVICTGVPTLMTHQLSLLPGTELYEKKEELAIQLYADLFDVEEGSVSERSDYLEYIVVGHKKMTFQDMKTGARLLGVTHVLHNHNLGKVVTFYLARYGLGVREIYTHFNRLLQEGAPGFKAEHQALFRKLNEMITAFAEHPGSDETRFYRAMSQVLWFQKGAAGYPEPRGKRLQDFFLEFFKDCCRRYGIELSDKERSWLSAAVRFNCLIAPKPVWRTSGTFTLSLRFDEIWEDIQNILFSYGIDEDSAKKKKKDADSPAFNWRLFTPSVKDDIARLLSTEYLEGKSGPAEYTLHNPWKIPPSMNNIDWLIKSRNKRCKLLPVEAASLESL